MSLAQYKAELDTIRSAINILDEKVKVHLHAQRNKHSDAAWLHAVQDITSRNIEGFDSSSITPITTIYQDGPGQVLVMLSYKANDVTHRTEVKYHLSKADATELSQTLEVFNALLNASSELQ